MKLQFWKTVVNDFDTTQNRNKNKLNIIMSILNGN